MMKNWLRTKVWVAQRKGRFWAVLSVFSLIALPSVIVGAQNNDTQSHSCKVELEQAPYLDSEDLVRESSRDHLQDVYFTSHLKGWSFAGDGSLLSTFDGGRSWKSQNVAIPEIGFLRPQIGFQNPQVGWIAAEEQFLSTTNGGQTWRYTAPPVACTYHIYYATPKIGWLFSRPNRVFKTTDGGRTWRRQSVNFSDTEAPLDIACFFARECIIVGSKATAFTTSDGSNWSARDIPVPRSYTNPIPRRKSPIRLVDITQVKVTRDGAAWAIAGWLRSGYVFRSDDRGRSWKAVGRELPELPNASVFRNRKKGLIAGSGIHWTDDGGVTWKEAVTPGDAEAFVNAIYFINEKVGWAVGDFKTILHTTDGGKNWIIQHAEGLPR